MKADFQDELLRFLVQTKEAKKFFDLIDSDIFDLQERQIMFDLVKAYLTEYKTLPSKVGLDEFFDKEANKKNLSKEIYNKLSTTIADMFAPIQTNTQQIRDALLEFYQQKLAKQFIKEYAAQVKVGDKELFSAMERQMRRIAKVGETELDEEKNRGEFLIKDHTIGHYSITEGKPTYLKGLNHMTSVKGFYAPQLVILMGGPKSFKTGTMLNIAVNYVRDGLKVYYADAENGKDRIRDRARQCMLEATFEELISGRLDDTLEEMIKRFAIRGGDFRADFFPAYTKTMDDVEQELEYLRDEFNWVPDVICYDSIDHFLPIDKSIKEKRHMITAVYFNAINLQNKWNMLGISVSQVNRAAVSKKVLDMTAFAEDFAKAANCHAAFALCSDDKEKEVGIIRIVPVVQRDGVPYAGRNVCFTKVDPARMTLKEITIAEASKLLPEAVAEKPKGDVIKRPRSLNLKNPKDE